MISPQCCGQMKIRSRMQLENMDCWSALETQCRLRRAGQDRMSEPYSYYIQLSHSTKCLLRPAEKKLHSVQGWLSGRRGMKPPPPPPI